MKTEEYGFYNIGTVAGLVIGIGMGGFLDGTLLHMILQWHHMLSSIEPPNNMTAIHVNMRWDGYFHAFTWIITALGIGLLWKAGRNNLEMPSGQVFIGSLITGFGLFNLAEGIINHMILGIHHVRETENYFAWDLGFVLLGGIGLIALGASVMWLDKRNRLVTSKN